MTSRENKETREKERNKKKREKERIRKKREKERIRKKREKERIRKKREKERIRKKREKERIKKERERAKEVRIKKKREEEQKKKKRMKERIQKSRDRKVDAKLVLQAQKRLDFLARLMRWMRFCKGKLRHGPNGASKGSPKNIGWCGIYAVLLAVFGQTYSRQLTANKSQVWYIIHRLREKKMSMEDGYTTQDQRIEFLRELTRRIEGKIDWKVKQGLLQPEEYFLEDIDFGVHETLIITIEGHVYCLMKRQNGQIVMRDQHKPCGVLLETYLQQVKKRTVSIVKSVICVSSALRNAKGRRLSRHIGC